MPFVPDLSDRLVQVGFPAALAEELQTAIQGPVSGAGKTPGYRTVLFGDSMTDTYETIGIPSAVAYDAASGIATITKNGHQQATGWYVYFWSRSYAATLKGWRVQVTRIDANNFTIQLPQNLPGVPASAWASSLLRGESWRSAQAFVPWLQAISGQRFNIVNNGALSGDTTQNALDRFDTAVAAYSPQVVIMQTTGINDTSTGNGNISEDTIAANQQTIVNRILALGARLILLNSTGVVSGEGRGTITNMMRVQRLNHRLREFCRDKPGVIYFDANRRITDPADANGLALPNFLRTTDKIHYSMRGGQYIAAQLWSQISALFPSDNSTLPISTIDSYLSSAITLTSVARSGGVVTGTSNAHGYQVGERFKLTGGSESLNEFVTLSAVTTNTVSFVTAGGNDGSITGTIRLGRSRNLMPNPLLITATGGEFTTTGTNNGVALNYRIQAQNGSPSVVASVVARADGYGNNQRMVVTPAAAGDQLAILPDFTTKGTALPAVVKPGRTYVFECSLSLINVSGSNLTEVRPLMSMTIDGVLYQTYALNGYAEGADLNSDIVDYHVRTAPFVMPAGSAVTFVQGSINFTFSAVGTALTIETGRWQIHEAE